MCVRACVRACVRVRACASACACVLAYVHACARVCVRVCVCSRAYTVRGEGRCLMTNLCEIISFALMSAVFNSSVKCTPLRLL